MISFSDLPLHPSIAAALSAREYTTSTPVQAAVLDPALFGKDLLVSAPTGSGKTVAFGTLIAQSVLAEKAAPAEAAAKAESVEGADGAEAVEAVVAKPAPRKAGSPRALVVAPTRELANQVGTELGWLLAKAKLRIGAFTGGTSVVGDVRRLRAGLDVVVGTPGRLVDLHERGSLDLSSIEVLVLDEADEMLDLGFREALEYLLSKAPVERRTLLFSATLPPDINRLAAKHQRDAVRVDPRAKGAAAPHADIEHFAHLVRPQDRLASVVNVLTAAGNGKAIVFCRTREGVGELHQRLVDHGFRAVAMSGDRAQGDRDRALGSLRSGRARILVATNVAARGLDLPDVELVLHADLPENAEALTHRSGRTGRAGRKGRSVVIADVRERRKAERLLHGARTQARWTPAPTAADVRRAMVEGLLAELMESAHDRREAEESGAEANVLTADLADRLRAALPERVLIAELLARELSRLPAPLPLEPLDPNQRPEPPRLSAGQRAGKLATEPRPGSYGPGWTDAVLFRVNLGAGAKAEPGWLLPLICRRGGVTRREVGAIRVGPQFSTFEISSEAAADFALAAAERDPRAPHVTIEPADAPERRGPDRGPPERAARAPERPARAPERPRAERPATFAPEPAEVARPEPVAARVEEDTTEPAVAPAPVAATPVAPAVVAPVAAAPARPARAKPAKVVEAKAPEPSGAEDGLAAIDDLVNQIAGGGDAAIVPPPKPAKAKPAKAKAQAADADEVSPKKDRPAPYFAAASGKRGSAVQVERRMTPAPARPRPEASAPRFGADAPPPPRYGAGPGPKGGPRFDGPPARGPRFDGAPARGPRSDGGPPARGPRFDGGPPARGPRFDGGPPARGPRVNGGPPSRGPRFDAGAPAPRFGAGGPAARPGAGGPARGPRFGGARLDRPAPAGDGGFEPPRRFEEGRRGPRPGGFSPRPGSKAPPSGHTADRPRRGRPRSPS